MRAVDAACGAGQVARQLADGGGVDAAACRPRARVRRAQQLAQRLQAVDSWAEPTQAHPALVEQRVHHAGQQEGVGAGADEVVRRRPARPFRCGAGRSPPAGPPRARSALALPRKSGTVHRLPLLATGLAPRISRCWCALDVGHATSASGRTSDPIAAAWASGRACSPRTRSSCPARLASGRSTAAGPSCAPRGCPRSGPARRGRARQQRHQALLDLGVGFVPGGGHQAVRRAAPAAGAGGRGLRAGLSAPPLGAEVAGAEARRPRSRGSMTRSPRVRMSRPQQASHSGQMR
jgi:hypothetical protein